MKNMQLSTIDNNNPPISHEEDKVLSLTRLARRWNCTLQTAKGRVRKFGIPLVYFNEKAKGVMLSSVLRTEQELSRPLAEKEAVEA
jgi:hypothetical protein